MIVVSRSVWTEPRAWKTRARRGPHVSPRMVTPTAKRGRACVAPGASTVRARSGRVRGAPEPHAAPSSQRSKSEHGLPHGILGYGAQTAPSQASPARRSHARPLHGSPSFAVSSHLLADQDFEAQLAGSVQAYRVPSASWAGPYSTNRCAPENASFDRGFEPSRGGDPWGAFGGDRGGRPSRQDGPTTKPSAIATSVKHTEHLHRLVVLAKVDEIRKSLEHDAPKATVRNRERARRRERAKAESTSSTNSRPRPTRRVSYHRNASSMSASASRRTTRITSNRGCGPSPRTSC